MTATETTDTILDALLTAEGGLTLSGLAEATGLPCAELRAGLDALGDTRVTATLETPPAAEPVTVDGEVIGTRGELPAALNRKVRVFRATEVARCAREAVLALLAEQGTEDALRAETRETLRAAALVFGVAGVKAKDTKDALVAAILAHRAAVVGAVCSRCGEEPVDRVGQVCTVCEESAEPAPAAERAPRGPRKPRAERPEGDLRIRIRRPDVALALTDEERATVESIVKSAESSRGAQRAVGEWLAARAADGVIDAEVLRTILRTHGALNAANFTINAKKDGWRRVDGEGGALKGWTIPNHNVRITAR